MEVRAVPRGVREDAEMTSSDPQRAPVTPQTGPAPGHLPEPARPVGRRRRFDRPVLRRPDLAVVAGTVLQLVFTASPWFRIDAFDLGSGYRFPAVSVNGFDSAALTCAAVLQVLAAGWVLLPAAARVPVPFPRSSLTAGLAAVAFVLTLVEWLTTFDTGFTLMGLLTFLCSVGVLVAAAWALLSELRADRT
jgi:hypothetical protein